MEPLRDTPRPCENPDVLIWQSDEELRELRGATGPWALDEIDFFPLAAYALANRFSLAQLERRRFGRVKSVFAASLSSVATKLGQGHCVVIQPASMLADADVFMIAGVHRQDQFGGESFLMPVDPLRLALEGAGIRVAVFYYAKPGNALPRGAGLISHGWGKGVHLTRVAEQAINSWEGTTGATRIFRRLQGGSPALIKAWLAKIVALTLSMRNEMGKLLSARRPRAVIVCGGVDPFTAGAIIAAREAHVPTFELQHGHLRNFDPRVSGMTAKGSVVAEHFLAWTDATPLSVQVRSTIVGSPLRILRSSFVEASRPGFGCILAASEARIGNMLADLPRPIGLVTKQPGIATYKIAATEAERLGLATLIWRHHPREIAASHDHYASLVNRDSLGLVLENVDHHLTYSSAAALEAYDVGVPTSFLSEMGHLLAPKASSPPERRLGEIGLRSLVKLITDG